MNFPPQKRRRLFPSAHEDAVSAKKYKDSEQCLSPTYKLAYQDVDFLLRDDLRPVRLQLELLKPELIQREEEIESTIVIFGSARIPDPKTAAHRFKTIEKQCQGKEKDPNILRKLKIAKHAGRAFRNAHPCSDKKD